jgi:hypothetical protein
MKTLQERLMLDIIGVPSESIADDLTTAIDRLNTLEAALAEAQAENARLLAERPMVQREAFRAGYTAPGYGNAEAEAQARRRYPDLPAEKQP